MRARHRAQAKLELYKHAALYVCIIGALGVLNLFTWSHYPWFLWPAVGWGIGLFAHGMNVFVGTKRLLERMTQRELRRVERGDDEPGPGKAAQNAG